MTISLGSSLTALAIYLLVFAIGAWMARFPRRQTGKIEQRIADGDDRFFEEQRAYRSYPRLRDPRFIRRTGVALMALATALGAMRHMQIS